MRISQKDLKLILKEALELSPGNKEKTIAALKQKIGAEGGAMGGAEAKETAETESGVEMSDDDFEELASSAGIETHDDGDVVDTTGLAEGNKMKITKRQLRQIIKEEATAMRPGFSRADDPGRQMLKIHHSELMGSKSTDPVVGALHILIEEIAFGTDIKDPSRALHAIEDLKRAIRGS